MMLNLNKRNITGLHSVNPGVYIEKEIDIPFFNGNNVLNINDFYGYVCYKQNKNRRYLSYDEYKNEWNSLAIDLFLDYVGVQYVDKPCTPPYCNVDFNNAIITDYYITKNCLEIVNPTVLYYGVCDEISEMSILKHNGDDIVVNDLFERCGTLLNFYENADDVPTDCVLKIDLTKDIVIDGLYEIPIFFRTRNFISTFGDINPFCVSIV